VLVPARDEAARIAPTLESLQHLEGVEEIIVLDDNSHDGTADMVEAAGLCVIRGTDEPPSGWLGKPWACQRLADAASGEVLLFVDADVVLRPDAAVRTAGLLTDLDLVCPYPHQEVQGALQHLVQPLLQWSWLSFLPLRLAENTSHPMLSAGNGQLLAVRREAYYRAGGHAAVKDEVLEDLALVRQFKRTGHRTGMADGTDVANCRMYASDSDLVAGYTKSLHDALGPGTVGTLAALYLIPPVAALIARDPRTRTLGIAGYAAAVTGRVAVARRTGQSMVACAAHPLSITALLWLYARSVRAHRRGTLTWRGRSLPS
jgi:glycosyltransferase involved in cell wall biosynthesis